MSIYWFHKTTAVFPYKTHINNTSLEKILQSCRIIITEISWSKVFHVKPFVISQNFGDHGLTIHKSRKDRRSQKESKTFIWFYYCNQGRYKWKITINVFKKTLRKKCFTVDVADILAWLNRKLIVYINPKSAHTPFSSLRASIYFGQRALRGALGMRVLKNSELLCQKYVIKQELWFRYKDNRGLIFSLFIAL